VGVRPLRSPGKIVTVLAALAALGALGAAPKPPYDAGRAATPRLFAEGVVSTEDDESNGSFSPDGAEYFFTRVNPYTTSPHWGVLCVTRFRGGRWSPAEVLPFSGRHLDLSPRLSPDGRTLYFASSRPAPGSTARVLRIWSAERAQGGWGEPRPLPAPVNSESDWNFSPSVTRDGTLYFASSRGGGDHTHLYRSRPVHGAYGEPERLGGEVNSDVNEADPFVTPDERILVFSSSGDGPPTDKDRSETVKGGGVLYPRGDLYVSFGEGGKWSKARHVGHGVNTFADEGSPSITPDGRYLFFTSERSPFSVPTSHRMDASEIERALRGTLNGHGNVFFVGIKALDPPRGLR